MAGGAGEGGGGVGAQMLRSAAERTAGSRQGCLEGAGARNECGLLVRAVVVIVVVVVVVTLVVQVGFRRELRRAVLFSLPHISGQCLF